MSFDDDAGSSPASGEAPPSQSAMTDSDVSNSAASSPAESGEQPASMLEAVKTALHPIDKGDADTPPAQTEGQSTDPKALSKDDDPLPDEVTEDELREQKPRTAKRIRQLLGKVSERDAAISELVPKAEAIDQLTGYLKQTGISVEDLNSGIEIMALLRNNPVAALERLAPTIQFLQQFAGQVLPDDLHDKVAKGFIDEPTARELAFRRNNERLQAQRQEEQAAQQEAERTRYARESFRASVEATGNRWQAAKQVSDPDWAAKAPRVMELLKVELLDRQLAGTLPRTPEETVGICEEIYSRATKEFKKNLPPPKSVTPPGPNTHSHRAEAEPKSIQDAVRLAIRKA